MLGYVHEKKVHGLQWVVSIGAVRKMQCLRVLPYDSKHNEVNLFFNDFDGCVMLMRGSDAAISKSGNFCADNR